MECSSAAGTVDDQRVAEYTALVIRRDGQAAVLVRTRSGVAAVAAWRPHQAVLPNPGGADPVKNVIRVEVDPLTVSLWANGVKVVGVPKSEMRASGRVGFRVGKDLNLHITSLDVTQRLAPQPVKKRTP